MADIRSFVIRDDAAKAMVDYSETLAKSIRKVTTTQIRNVYGTVKKLEMYGLSEITLRKLLLLKPKMAYTRAKIRGKENVDAYKEFEEAIGTAIDAVDIKYPETFTRFCNFFEAIVAFHKAYCEK